ncbi:MAG TPA: BON domain-containing protein [Steroidobacteraceae bacterium]|nr:BON domain-containing protein [Steroidobacteraceae bacterium]
MISDSQVRDSVEAELDWDARVDSRQIGVAVQDGIVTLTGQVDSYVQRRVAEQAAQSVAGVKAVANDIAINLPFDGKRTDTEIARAAIDVLAINVSVPSNSVKVAVHDGWITLEGEVSTWYQKSVAENALVHMRGVTGISNHITVRKQPSVRDVERKIAAALHRRAQLDANSIHVSANDGTVTLQGEVGSWSERSEAEFAAWQAPGVAKVVDNLSVR